LGGVGGGGGRFPCGLSSRGVQLASYMHVVVRLRMSGAVPPLACVVLWRVQKRCFRRKKKSQKLLPSCASTINTSQSANSPQRRECPQGREFHPEIRPCRRGCRRLRAPQRHPARRKRPRDQTPSRTCSYHRRTRWPCSDIAELLPSPQRRWWSEQ